ncbi:hypothetical protein CLOP_g5219 [Closterium sp. NIES-67]|nr:hypothetical protein CLOP_g5219 [Closterium sp. NIES-67]
MVPWGLIVSVAAYAAFPQHRTVIVAVSAVGSLVRGGKKKGKAVRHKSFVAGDPDRGVKLEWSSITCQLLDKKGNEVKKLLDGLNGSARPGRLLRSWGRRGRQDDAAQHAGRPAAQEQQDRPLRIHPR